MLELDLKTLFPFELDDFQRQAIAALDSRKSVVVCAPTGSGKTLIGEYAIYRALAHGRRVFYTTPIKALSNQKFRDFCHQFGKEQVGLLTGDMSIFSDSQILVMTTEIFRNMLYGTDIGDVGTSLNRVDAVVLDECHYVNDSQRGTVWEESIIYCPPSIQLVALSATVANKEQLTNWISQVHGPTELVASDYRPVPLEYHFCDRRGLFPLLDRNQRDMNPLLKARKVRRKGERGRFPQEDCPTIGFVLSQILQRDMLPAIYFIFSRRGCERAVAELGSMSLLNVAESEQVKNRLDQFIQDNYHHNPDQIASLYRGMAAHHAGVLPMYKNLIEELFQQGLLKVVFATETLAVGINMPARTTVISSLSKRTDEGHRMLNKLEFLQMAGRAGRRGMDEQGHVVTVQTPFEGTKEAVKLTTKEVEPLRSQFTPSYGMVLNLLQTRSLAEAKELVESSFNQHLATSNQQQAIASLKGEINFQTRELAEYEKKLSEYGYGDIESIGEQLSSSEKLKESIKVEQKTLKNLQNQAQQERTKDLAAAINFAVTGTILSLKGKYVKVATPVPAVLVEKIPGSGIAPELVCLGKDNRWYVATVADVVELHAEVPRLRVVDELAPPNQMLLQRGKPSLPQGDAVTAQIAQQIPVMTMAEPAEVVMQRSRIKALQEEMEQHPVGQWRDRGKIVKQLTRAGAVQAQIKKRQVQIEKCKQDLEDQLARNWEEFICLIEILKEFNCLIDDGERLQATALGQLCAALRGDNELWLGLALMSEELEYLKPEQLATVCAALITEESERKEKERKDNWTEYELSAEVKQTLTGPRSRLRSIRQRLNKVQQRYKKKTPMLMPPVWLERDLIAIVEKWASDEEGKQVSWLELCEHTSVDEGDVVRMLRRTLDLLSQVPRLPHLSKRLRRNGSVAMDLMKRFPIDDSGELEV
ncbi:MAG: DEAD/DEAH box helicase [Hormoscilla sp. SP12CHS1]|nr:DEAD/DEAH box helicase [Hormoscilla sp. SP12CHS1]